MSIAEKLVTVAENVPKVFNAGQLSVISQSEALKGFASGSSVTIKDISPVEHDVPCKVGSKNLLNSAMLLEAKGWTETDSVYSGSIGNLYEAFNTSQKPLFADFEPNTQYTLTFKGNSAKEHSYGTLGFVFKHSDGTNKSVYMTSATETAYTLTSEVGKSVIGLYVSYGESDTAYLREIQLKKGSTATAYTPYVDLSTVKVQRLGKNLCNTGTATFTIGIKIELPTPLPAKTPFVFSSIFESDYTGSSNLIQFNYTDGTSCSNADMASWNTKKPTERQSCTRANGLPKDLKSISFYAGYGWGNSGGYTGTLTNVQLEIGSTATEYEPYIEPIEYTANADGTVEGVKSLYPTTTLMTDTEGVNISAEYIKDIDKAFTGLTTAIAMSGGE